MEKHVKKKKVPLKVSLEGCVSFCLQKQTMCYDPDTKLNQTKLSNSDNENQWTKKSRLFKDFPKPKLCPDCKHKTQL